MKAKTVWLKSAPSHYPAAWLEEGEVMWDLKMDVSWINVYGLPIMAIELYSNDGGSKIIGDE